MHDALRGAFQAVKEKLALLYAQTPPDSSSFDSSQFMAKAEQLIAAEFQKTAALVGGIFVRMKMFSYTLSVTGEAEAICQARDKSGNVHVSRDDTIEIAVSNADGENIGARIQYAFSKLTRRLLDAVQLSRLQRDSVAGMLERLDRAIPKGSFVKRMPKTLKSIKEADRVLKLAEGKVDLSVGFIDDDAWREMVDYYLTEYVPTYQFRGPTPDSDYFYKDFELEQDLTHEFVSAVRSGQNEAAKQNGIVDFQWIAVIDDRTCDDCCGAYGCGDFDGKSTSQVEKMTGGATVVPPAHYNCRCTIAPLLDTMPDEPESNAKEFDEWLNS